LVRNVLAATVRQDRVETASGHALIIYDERNPAFWPGGDARSAYDAVCAALRHSGLLRTVSWQRVIGQLSAVRDLRWLVDGLEAKYGLITPGNTLPTPLETLQVCSEGVVRGGVEPPTFRFSGVADAQIRPDAREYVAVHGCVGVLTTAVVAVMVAVRHTIGPPASPAGSHLRRQHSFQVCATSSGDGRQGP
jgi:hypothetical protein